MPMSRIAWGLVALIAALHIYFLIMEMFFWSKIAPRVAGLEPAIVQATTALGANQGLYNGFLAAGLIWSLHWSWVVDVQRALFFVLCVLIAGLYGAFTIKPINRILLGFQALPAACALVALWRLG
jgi:putative membrane protein